MQATGQRDENPEYDLTEAKKDAANLLKAGEQKWGTDESFFNQVYIYITINNIYKYYD